jgi:PAS domain S-box-containing protein
MPSENAGTTLDSAYARSLIEASLDPLVTISSEGKITDVNQATVAVTGVGREKLIGSDSCDYFTEPENARKGYKRVFEQGTVRDYPLAIRHVSGRITDVLYNASVYKNEAGEVQGVFAAARDITRRKRAGDALRARKAELRGAQRMAKLGGWYLNVQTGKVVWTEEIHRIFGLDPKLPAPMYQQQKQILAVDSWERLDAAIEKTRRTGEPYDIELQLIRPDGSYRWITTRGEAVRDEAGQVVRLHGTAQDVTERKEAEESLAKKTQELVRSNEELAQFAYAASHDLQEPLRKIVAFGGRLTAHCGETMDEQARDYLDRMQNAAHRMSQLIDSLLALSQVTSRRRILEPVDLNQVVADVLNDLEVRVQESGGRVDVGQLPTLMADRFQMHQLFQNLIGNALKFHKQDVPPVVQVHAVRSAKAWEIHVEDNGIGFDE